MGVGLYIHVPFCIRKCAYCDFYSVPLEPGLLSRYTGAVVAEVGRVAEQHPCLTIDTVYFGGGTPSLLTPREIERILREVSSRFKLATGAEISLEANPGTFDSEKMKGFREGGINRVSIGAQSLNDQLLRLLGRIHSREDVYGGVEACRRAGFNNLNLDLIYGIPGLDEGMWSYTLQQAVDLKPTHISCYLLQLEPGIPLARRVDLGELQLLSEESEADHYEAAIEYLNGHGYCHYELSNFAVAGYECRHNLIYWRGGDYLGLGPGAVSFVEGRRYQNISDLPAYLEALERGCLPPSQDLEYLKGKALLEERIILGLRLIEGIDSGQIRDKYGVDILSEFSEPIQQGVAAGLLEITGERIRLTRKGYFLSNEVFRGFLG